MAREMKDSGIPWIGEIPLNWNTIRIKNLCVFNPNPKPIDFERVGYAPMNTIRNGRIDASEIEVKNLSSVLTYFEDGDIVMAKVTPCFENGNIAIASGLKNGCAYGSSELFVFRSTNISTPFLFYALQNETFKSLCVSTMTGTGGLKRISAPFVANSFLPVPPSKEQQSIANFLDEKCSEIEELISIQEKMINELKSYKQSVITEAVTKGLDRNVNMKDSCIDWIGEIPEHWNTTKLKNIILTLDSGCSVNAENIPAKDTEYGVLKTSCVSKNYFILSENKKVEETEYNRVKCPVKADTIIVSRMNTPELVGASAYCEYDVSNIFLPDRLWQVDFNKEEMYTKYIWYFLISTNTKQYYSSLSAGTSSSMQNISQPQFENAFIAFPTKKEQILICEYLDKTILEIDTLISIKQQKIEELKEYKKSLIYEYVTGKKEVV